MVGGVSDTSFERVVATETYFPSHLLLDLQIALNIAKQIKSDYQRNMQPKSSPLHPSDMGNWKYSASPELGPRM